MLIRGMKCENCFLFYFNYFFIRGEIRIWFIQDENMFKNLIVLKGKSETEANKEACQTPNSVIITSYHLLSTIMHQTCSA